MALTLRTCLDPLWPSCAHFGPIVPVLYVLYALYALYALYVLYVLYLLYVLYVQYRRSALPKILYVIVTTCSGRLL